MENTVPESVTPSAVTSSRPGRLAALFSTAGNAPVRQHTVSKLEATEENLLNVWRKYLEAESEKESSAFYINFIKLLEPRWDGNAVLTFQTDNTIALSALERLKIDIAQFIKERVELEQLQIITHLLESGEKKERTYVTLEEQLSEAKQANPAIHLLIQKLGLEL